MNLSNRIAYFFATMGPLGSWSEGGALAAVIGFVTIWFLPSFCLVSFHSVAPCMFIELGLLVLIFLVIRHALLDSRVVWYGEIPVAPEIVLDAFCGALLAVYGFPRQLLVYAIALVLYLMLVIFRPLGISEARVLPGVWGVIGDDIAAGLLTHVFLRLISDFLISV